MNNSTYTNMIISDNTKINTCANTNSNNKNLKRHAVSFTKGLPGASKMRVELHSMPTQEKMGQRVKLYLEELTELDSILI